MEYHALEPKRDCRKIFMICFGFLFMFMIGLFTGMFAFSSHYVPPLISDLYTISEVGSDYAIIDYQIQTDKNITLNEINLFFDSKKNNIFIRNLEPNTKYLCDYFNFTTTDYTEPSKIDKIYSEYNNGLMLYWQEPKTFGGHAHIYEIEFLSKVHSTNKTYFYPEVNTTTIFKIRVVNGSWSEDYLCIFTNQKLVVPVFCGFEITNAIIYLSSTSTTISISWTGYVEFIEFDNNKYYPDNAYYTFSALIPATDYSFIINSKEYSISTQESLYCGNKNDLNVIITKKNSLLDEFQSATFSCVLSTDIAICASEKIKDILGFSSGCAECFGKNSKCAVSNCASKCIINSKSESCISCSVDNCSSSLASCIGIPANLLPDPRNPGILNT